MGETRTSSKQEAPATGSGDYAKFMILAEARTGSTMLVRALTSHPSIRCFGEVFNKMVPFVAFGVDGYDNFSARERTRRDRDFTSFLRERIYCSQPEEIRAVGFKTLYGQFWGFRGLLEHLVDDAEIRVLHLKRRNILRMLVSLKMAQATGVWVEIGGSKFTLANLLRASRHPLRAAAKLPRLLRPPMLAGKPRRETLRVRVTITKDELFKFIIRTKSKAGHLDDRFQEHPRLTLFYEDMLEQRVEVFNQVQTFLGVEPTPLAVTLRRQNPEPLRDLLENYDHLYEAYRNTPHAWMFD